jgi:hypothetical protein
MSLVSVFHRFLGVLSLVLLSSPTSSPWSSLAVWAARVLTIALLTRTYGLPTLVAMLSKRVRVRSVSLRSVRGLYLRSGRATITSERIKLGLRWVPDARALRMRITVQNLDIQIAEPLSRKKAERAARRAHRRMPTLADLDPSPHAWSAVSTLTSSISRALRPAATAIAVALLRLVVLALPTLTQVLEIELDTVSIVSASTGARLDLNHATLSSRLEFSPADGVEPASGSPAAARLGKEGVSTMLGRLTAFLRFLSLQNTEKAWSSTQCNISLSLSVGDIAVCAPSLPQPPDRIPVEFGTRYFFPRWAFFSLTLDLAGLSDGTFLSLPKGIRITLSARIIPSTRSIDTDSVDIFCDLGKVHLAADIIHKLLRSRKKPQDVETDCTESGDAMSAPPSENESPMSPVVGSSLSPTSPRRFRSIDPFSVSLPIH